MPTGGRQKDFVDTEKSLGRIEPAQISAIVGYAGGQVRQLARCISAVNSGYILRKCHVPMLGAWQPAVSTCLLRCILGSMPAQKAGQRGMMHLMEMASAIQLCAAVRVPGGHHVMAVTTRCCVLQATGPDGKVCYYYNGDPRTIYERLVSSSSLCSGSMLCAC